MLLSEPLPDDARRDGSVEVLAHGLDPTVGQELVPAESDLRHAYIGVCQTMIPHGRLLSDDG
jgi:hypothetical protein